MFTNVKVDFVHWKWPKREDGIYPIKMRVTFGEKRKYYGKQFGISVRVNEKAFKSIMGNPRGENRKVRDFLEKCKALAEQVVTDIGPFNFSYKAFETNLFKKDKANTLNSSIKDYADSVNASKTKEAYLNTEKQLRYFKRKEVKFSAVNVEFLKSFENFLAKKGNSESTIMIHARNIRTVFNKAISDGEIDESYSPFGKGKYVIRKAKSSKKLIPIEVIKKLIKYSGEHQFERDVFVLSFFLGGANAIDVFSLRKSDLRGQVVSFRRKKTSSKVVASIEMPLIDVTQKIIDNNNASKLYLFDALGDHIKTLSQVENKSKKLRRYINKVLKEHFGGITLHEARHSFQTYCTEAGIQSFVISNMVGHSEGVTSGYITVTPKVKKESLIKLKEYILQS